MNVLNNYNINHKKSPYLIYFNIKNIKLLTYIPKHCISFVSFFYIERLKWELNSSSICIKIIINNYLSILTDQFHLYQEYFFICYCIILFITVQWKKKAIIAFSFKIFIFLIFFIINFIFNKKTKIFCIFYFQNY